MNSPSLLCLAGVVWSVAACAAGADVVNLSAAHDNTLYQSASGAVSNGAGPGFTTGNISQGGIRRALLSFDIAASVPAGAVIQSVSLQLHMSRTVSGSADVSLYRAQADWGEGTSNAGNNDGQGAPATTGDATWIHRFFNTVFWANAGGDFAGASSAVAPVDQIGFYTWSAAGMAADVQSWLDAPAGAFGWGILIDGAAPGTTKRFDSREAVDPMLRPMLTVTYMVPGPGGAVLGLLAGLAGARRRRRSA